MDLRKLKKLIDLVQESGISELEITEGEEKVKIVKSGGPELADEIERDGYDAFRDEVAATSV